MMSNIIRALDVNDMGNFEYLGTVSVDGRQYIALQPLVGSFSRQYFLSCEEDGTYGWISDAEMVKAVGSRFRRGELDEPGGPDDWSELPVSA